MGNGWVYSIVALQNRRSKLRKIGGLKIMYRMIYNIFIWCVAFVIMGYAILASDFLDYNIISLILLLSILLWGLTVTTQFLSPYLRGYLYLITSMPVMFIVWKSTGFFSQNNSIHSLSFLSLMFVVTHSSLTIVCTNCKTWVYQFNKTPSFNDGLYISIDCPVCKTPRTQK